MDKYTRVENMLYNYKMYKISIENMEEEINALQEECGVGGIDFGSPSGNTNKVSSITENTALSRSERIAYNRHQIERIERELSVIDRTIEQLTDLEKTIIIERYINSKQWWEVASIVCYSERWCKDLRKRAVNKLVVGIYGEK